MENEAKERIRIVASELGLMRQTAKWNGKDQKRIHAKRTENRTYVGHCLDIKTIGFSMSTDWKETG